MKGWPRGQRGSRKLYEDFQFSYNHKHWTYDTCTRELVAATTSPCRPLKVGFGWSYPYSRHTYTKQRKRQSSTDAGDDDDDHDDDDDQKEREDLGVRYLIFIIPLTGTSVVPNSTTSVRAN